MHGKPKRIWPRSPPKCRCRPTVHLTSVWGFILFRVEGEPCEEERGCCSNSLKAACLWLLRMAFDVLTTQFMVLLECTAFTLEGLSLKCSQLNGVVCRGDKRWD